MSEKGDPRNNGSTKDSSHLRIYVLLGKVIGIAMVAMGALFFLLTLTVPVPIILVIIGIIVYVIGLRAGR